MPARRLLVRKIREILRLKHERGLSHRAIAQACAIDQDHRCPDADSWQTDVDHVLGSPADTPRAMTGHGTADDPSVTLPGPNGQELRLTRPRPRPGPWRRHERESARTLDHLEHDVLMAPDAFDDEAATDEDLHRLLAKPDPRATGPNSETVRLRMCSSCAGWAQRPTPAELYAAIRSENPTSREKSMLRMWANEPEWLELIQAWAERVYTLRDLVTALHRAGVTRSRHSRTLNRWGTRTSRKA